MLKRALCEWALVDVISKKEQIIFLTSVKEETKSSGADSILNTMGENHCQK